MPPLGAGHEALFAPAAFTDVTVKIEVRIEWVWLDREELQLLAAGPA
jgi:hypothetical protein